MSIFDLSAYSPMVAPLDISFPNATNAAIAREVYRTCIDAARRGEVKPNAPYLRNCYASTVQSINIPGHHQDEILTSALNSREIALLFWGELLLAWPSMPHVVRRVVRDAIAVVDALLGVTQLVVPLFAELGGRVVAHGVFGRGGWERLFCASEKYRLLDTQTRIEGATK